jgi:hypothetical protein
VINSNNHCRLPAATTRVLSQVRSDDNSGRSNTSVPSANFHCSMWLASINHPTIPRDMFQRVAAYLNNPVKGIKRLICIVRINIYITQRLALTSATQLGKTVCSLQHKATNEGRWHQHIANTWLLSTPRLPTSPGRIWTYNTAHKKRNNGTQHTPDTAQRVHPFPLLAEWYTARSVVRNASSRENVVRLSIFWSAHKWTWSENTFTIMRSNN